MKRSSTALLTLTIFLLSQYSSLGQSNIPVLGWRTNFSYQDVKQLAIGEQTIYAATENTIYALDKASGTLERLNKITGLNDVGIGAIQILASQEALIVGYDNGNIDIVSENSIKNISTVKDFQTVQSKEYQSILVDGANIYLAGGLGIIVYNLTRNEITEAYQNLGENGSDLAINDLIIHNDSIFAATENGIMAASLASNINRQDFNNWTRTLVGIPFEHIAQTNEGLFASSDSDLFQRENGTWSFFNNYGQPITALEKLGNKLLISTENEVFSLFNSNATTIYSIANEVEKINSVGIDGTFLWLATNGFALARFNGSSQEIHSFGIPGPSQDLAFGAEKIDRNIFILPSSFNQLNHENSFSSYDHEINQWNNPSTNSIGQIIDIASANDELYFASFDQGLFKYNEDGTIESQMNSPSAPQALPNIDYQLSAIATDDAGIIWATFYDSNESLYSFNPSTGVWENYALNNDLGQFSTDIFIAKNGDKWLTIDPVKGGGILVFNETSSSERHLNFNGGQGGLPSNEVTDIELDDDLFVWVATSEGIAFFTNPNAVLNNQSLTASVPIFENRLLLRNEYITDIAIDAANRKWFGTRSNGLWLFNETGEELFYHFTINNSPIPSNNILSMAIEPLSGELLITTDKGSISFRSDATTGTDAHSNVKVYPNPVAPNFMGQIVIEGLVNNAQLKLTDVSGKLVKEIRANGSTAIWDVRDLNNSRVKSGVYLVFSASDDGLETYVAKIVVI